MTKVQIRLARSVCIAKRLLCYTLVASFALASAVAQSFDPAQGILLRGTIVTMDSAGTILHNGNVLVRDGRIMATWQGANPPRETQIGDAVQIDLGPHALIFPGLINLHNHPTYNMLELWPAPSSHVEASLGRPLGTEPYANRYQWNGMMAWSEQPPEFRRLVDTPQTLLNSPAGLNLYPEVGKYAEVKAMLGGETAFQGGPADPRVNNILIRNVGDMNFGRDQIESRVETIDALTDPDLSNLLERMQNGQIDAWLVHLAEGVRDSQRRAGDTFSSRSEFASLVSKGLLTDVTVIIHGTGLEPDDFAAMRAAPSIHGPGDGLGAKLVWSPLSNLLLYGQTALVYHALNAGIVISLGTDWSPSGSRTLLDELKIADITLRDPLLLGADRDLVPSLSTTGKSGNAREEAEIALDKLLVEMVTTNPAKTLRWAQEVGSIEPGKFADLVLITRPSPPPTQDLPNSPYRNLIEATEQDVRLVLVNGEPLAGDVAIMNQLKPGDYEVVTSIGGCFEKAIDVTNPSAPRGRETFSQIQTLLRDALNAMGGDNPPPGGGPADDSNTYSYLKAHIPGASGLTDAEFRQWLTFYFGLAPNGRLNMEGVQLSPVLIEDDDFYFHLLGGEVSMITGLIDNTTPPFGLYPANFNQIQLLRNPFIASGYRDRFYQFCIP